MSEDSSEQSKSETERERFEDWISVRRLRSVERVPSGVSGAGMYYDPEVALAWEAWQEAQTMSRDSMDREVAEKVMGWTFGGEFDDEWEETYYCDKFGVTVCPAHYWSPSTRIDHAWEVKTAIRNMKFSTRRKFGIALTREGQIRAGELVAWPDLIFFLEPIDVCRAALEAVKPQ